MVKENCSQTLFIDPQATVELVVLIFTQNVRTSVTKNALQRQHRGLKNKITDTMRENNDHLLAGAWWVILNSLDLFLHFFPRDVCSLNQRHVMHISAVFVSWPRLDMPNCMSVYALINFFNPLRMTTICCVYHTQSRGVDVKKRPVTTHFNSLLQDIIFGHNMTSYAYFFIGHILPQLRVSFEFYRYFSLLTINAAL